MIVVADSGLPHYLILLNHTELLHGIYGDVFAPVAVIRELSSAGAPRIVKEWLAAPPAWLRVRSVEPESLRAVSEHLDPGEREAIVLAESIGADLLLIDDFKAVRKPAVEI